MSNQETQKKAAHNGASFLDARHYILSEPEREAFVAEEPGAEKYIAPLCSSRSLLRGGTSFCLNLANCTDEELEALPKTKEKVDAVREFRENDARPGSRDMASRPREFETAPPACESFIAIPTIMSKDYNHIPAAVLDGNVVADNGVVVVPDGSMYDFGILSSAPHAAWMKKVGQHTDRTHRYAADLVYDSFPWPKNPTDAQRSAIEQTAKAILDARSAHLETTLSELYNPATMPDDLKKALEANDLAVLDAYGLEADAAAENLADALAAYAGDDHS